MRPYMLIFGGTSEGRLLAEWLQERSSCRMVVCCATEYGGSLVPVGKNTQVISHPMPKDEIEKLVEREHFTCIIDATHPFATHISHTLTKVAATFEVAYIRVVREELAQEFGHMVSGVGEAASMLNALPGKILFTTGSKDLAGFASEVHDFLERSYVRILPVESSLAQVRSLGLSPQHIVCMQGPFSVAFNVALIHELGISVVVTKASGLEGGMQEKVEAARECGCELVVIRRPDQAPGLSMEETRRLLIQEYGV
ncbi:MAG: precorrin-6A reductase [Atopobiaceae bacterium]|jgi:precorrin-6A/cobalt-precorrin-6A reductase